MLTGQANNKVHYNTINPCFTFDGFGKGSSRQSSLSFEKVRRHVPYEPRATFKQFQNVVKVISESWKFFKAISKKVTFVKKPLQKGDHRADTFNLQRKHSG